MCDGEEVGSSGSVPGRPVLRVEEDVRRGEVPCVHGRLEDCILIEGMTVKTREGAGKEAADEVVYAAIKQACERSNSWSAQ